MGNAYNIAQEVYDYAVDKGLDAMATGGGFDYIYATFNGRDITVNQTDDAGSPESLDERAQLVFFSTDNWDSGMWITFETTRQAIDVLASIKDVGLFSPLLP